MSVSVLSASGASLEQRVPRYSCYPTPACFGPAVGSRDHDAWLRSLPPGAELSLYVHIPFCRRLCWFCLCRTQAVRSLAVVDGFLDCLLVEAERTGRLLPPGALFTSIYWGGGSPAVLAPAQIRRLGRGLAERLPLAPGAELAVEIDAGLATPKQYDALADVGLARACIGVQDLSREVRSAIGRAHGPERCVEAAAALRARGISSISVDQVYGLPLQTVGRVEATARLVAALEPERVSLTGYVHAPWLAKRQRMVREEWLPDLAARLQHFTAAAAVHRAAGLRPIGIDHFAPERSPLDRAAQDGALRRGFGGYETDGAVARLGIGPGAISRFSKGFVQNHAQTGAYCAALSAGGSAAARGVSMGLEDRIRGRAIEMLMCSLRIDLAAIRAEFGDFVAVLGPGCAEALARYGDRVEHSSDALAIREDGPILARLVACLFDSRTKAGRDGGYSI